MRARRLTWLRRLFLATVLLTAIGLLGPRQASAAPGAGRLGAPDQEPTATPTASVPAQPTPVQPTVTPTQGPQNLLLRGLIYSAASAETRPIAGARIRVPPCQTPHQAFEATSGADGRYELTLPAPYFFPGCTVRIQVGAECFHEMTQELRWEQVRDRPVRDYGLMPIVGCVPGGGYLLYLPFTHTGDR